MAHSRNWDCYNDQPEPTNHAKLAAIVAVDEIVKSINTTTGHCELSWLDAQEVQSDLHYWYDVKKELEKL